MVFAPDDGSGHFCPPTPQAIPFPPSFLSGEAFATLQRATQKHSQSTGSVRDEDLWREMVLPEQQRAVEEDNPRTHADFNMATSFWLGAEGEPHLALAEGLNSVLGDPAPIKRKVPRPPKHIREESKRIAHFTYQMLASSTPMEDMKERLSHMMAPICRDQKNIDYTMSVLRAVCRDFDEILEMVVEGEEFAGAPATLNHEWSTLQPGDTDSHSENSDVPGATFSSQFVPQINQSEGNGSTGWHTSPWAGMTTASRPSLPTREHNGTIAVELGNVMVLLQ